MLMGLKTRDRLVIFRVLSGGHMLLTQQWLSHIPGLGTVTQLMREDAGLGKKNEQVGQDSTQK